MHTNDYIQITLSIKEPYQQNSEIASAYLISSDYEGFVEEDGNLLAYIPQGEFDEEKLNNITAELTQLNIIDSGFQTELIEDRNWNEVWEQNYFQPITIKDELYIRGSFHPENPNIKNEIVINPKMSFGTGHHQTTRMILEALIETNLQGKSVMDMGTGTGIFSIYAAQQNAKDIYAVDIDDWAVENAEENLELNGFKGRISLYKGDSDILSEIGKNYDVFLANINLGVLLYDAERYISHLNKNGEIYLSGFLKTDIETIKDPYKNLKLIDSKTDGDWAMLRFKN